MVIYLLCCFRKEGLSPQLLLNASKRVVREASTSLALQTRRRQGETFPLYCLTRSSVIMKVLPKSNGRRHIVSSA